MNYNKNFDKLSGDYIFKKVRQKAKNCSLPQKIIDLGVGDVKAPLFKETVNAMKLACDEFLTQKTFKGYPPAEGYQFLREKIAKEYQFLGVDIDLDEVFVTDGAKGQLGNLLELWGNEIDVLFQSPCYPVGAEASVLRSNNVDYAIALKQNDFIAYPPIGKRYDIIYLCSPCNPTGAVFSKKDLSVWINYALDTKTTIIFDGAYSSFISGDYPRSVYQIQGAKECVIEVNSFSKSLGFTGIRCGFTVIPKEQEKTRYLYSQWLGRRFNGVSYVSQRGAETFFNPTVREQLKKRINFYKTNAEILKIALKNINLWYNNTVCSPYVFAKTPKGICSTDFCDRLLKEVQIVATDGSGFCDGGEGYFRLSAFCSRQEALEASDRLKTLWR